MVQRIYQGMGCDTGESKVRDGTYNTEGWEGGKVRYGKGWDTGKDTVRDGTQERAR